MMLLSFVLVAHAGDFLDRHWGGVPVAGVKADTEGWGPLERSLLPKDCGSCHPSQLADWQGSRHAHAMGPGVSGQLLASPQGNDSCARCHTPLWEQRRWPAGEDNSTGFRAPLQATGMSCPVCHVRQGVLYGPPRREGRPAPSPALPHAGFVEEEAYLGSAFCGTCHQFSQGQRRVAGELLENTLEEWKQSPSGQAGAPCQSCHMPDRHHLWRGIHDPDFTEAALGIDLVLMSKRHARYSVSSRNVGHRFPTYVTPRVTLILSGLDAADHVVAREAFIIQRRVDLSLAAQPFDTRLAPGRSASVELVWGRKQKVVRVEGTVLVEPDEFYARFFQAYRSSDPEVASRIAQAYADTQANIYSIGARQLSVH